MNWSLQCVVCGKVLNLCMRESDVYHEGAMNITHCDQPMKLAEGEKG